MDNNTKPRVRVVDGYAVRDLPDGDQVRAYLDRDPYMDEPERGDGMWNEGVSLVRWRDGYNGVTLDEHDGLSAALERVTYCQDCRNHVVTREHDEFPFVERGCGWHTRYRKGIEEFVSRYLRAFHGVQHVSLRSHQGYSQSDWADVWVIAEGIEGGADPKGIADATWNEWDNWAKGDVYRVNIEHRPLDAAMRAEDPDDGWGESDMSYTIYGEEDARQELAAALGVDVKDCPQVYEVEQ